MKLIVKGGRLDVDRLRNLLNTVLSKYNIDVEMIEESSRGNKQVIDVRIQLRNSVYYSPFHSQYYDREKDEFFESSGVYLSSPDYKFGRKARYAHFYHFALFNDTIAYIMGTLKAKGLIEDWQLKSAVLTVKDEHWRRDFPYEYLPQFDPAFRRPLSIVKRVKGIRIPNRRDHAIEVVKRLPGYVDTGKLSPRDIPRFVDTLETFTSIKHLYNSYPKTLDEVEPLTRAYIILELGEEKGNEIIADRGMNAVAEYREKVLNWLETVSIKDKKFRKYISILTEELVKDLDRYSRKVGEVVEETLKDTDSAGFPFGLAKHLVYKPYIPDEVKNYDLEKLVESREKRIGVSYQQ
jgi:hypothetical protein